MRKLSKRESVMLFVLAVIAIFGLGISLWIMPLTLEINNLKLTNDTLKADKMRVQAYVNGIDDLRAKSDESESQVAALIDNISEYIVPSTFDSYVAIAAEGNGMTLEAISYGAIESVVPTAIASEKTTDDSEFRKLLEAYYNETSTPTEDSESLQVALQRQEITIKVTGSEAQLKQLIDALNSHEKTLYVRSVKIEKKDATLESTLSLDLYFLNQ